MRSHIFKNESGIHLEEFQMEEKLTSNTKSSTNSLLKQQFAEGVFLLCASCATDLGLTQ